MLSNTRHAIALITAKYDWCPSAAVMRRTITLWTTELQIKGRQHKYDYNHANNKYLLSILHNSDLEHTYIYHTRISTIFRIKSRVYIIY